MIDRLIDFVRVCVRTYVYMRVHAFVYARACARVRMRSQKEKVPGITTKISAALVVVELAAAAATVVILVVLRKLLWLSQGLFLSAGVFFIIK